MKYLCVAMAAFLLVACESNELYPVPAVPLSGGNGGSYSVPARSAPVQNPLAPAKMPMLQDPEGQLDDESITIYAKSLDEALTQCNQTATDRSDSQTIVSCLGCKLMTSPKTGRYACTLRIETRKQ